MAESRRRCSSLRHVHVVLLLLKGMRWVWIATVAVTVLGVVPDLIAGSLTWQEVVGGFMRSLTLPRLSIVR
jgi:hypothetical protein